MLPLYDIWTQDMLFNRSEQSSPIRRLSFLNSAGLEGGELPLILSPNYPPPNMAQTHTKPHVEKIKSEFQSSNQELSTQQSGATDCLKFPLLSKAVNRVSWKRFEGRGCILHSSGAAEEGVLNEPDRGCLACHYAASGEQASTGVHQKKIIHQKSFKVP